MGNSPSSMKDLPNSLNQNQYIEITGPSGEKFYVHPRTFTGVLKNAYYQQFSGANFALRGLGLNELADINNGLNAQKRSFYYITKTPEANEKNALRSIINTNLLKVYIKTFFSKMDFINNYKLDLEKSKFELKEVNTITTSGPIVNPNQPSGPIVNPNQSSSFGKKVNYKLKQLQRDLKRLKSS